jgi:periplasmic protein CpxP/Spy
MKPWIKKSLIAVFGASVVLGGLSACGSRGDHARGWSDERVTEMRGKVIERVSDKLELNAAQQQKLGVLADELIAQRKAWRAQGGDPRAEIKGLMASEKFDRSAAHALLERKTQQVQGAGPKVIAAFADFYDSLNPQQQSQVRERLDKRGHGGWGRG